MTVFKTFWQIIKRYKMMILLYTFLLLLFGGLNMKTNDTSLNFVDSKPDIMMIHEDEAIGITKSLIDYMSLHANVSIVSEMSEEIDDALFYRQFNYVIFIPKNYRSDVLNGLKPSITVKSTGDYQASLASMLLDRFLKTQEAFVDSKLSEQEILKAIDDALQDRTEVVVTSKLDMNELSQVTQYFNFASYTLMATIIFIICLVLSSFHEEKVKNRILVSKMSYRVHNRLILMASFGYMLFVFLLFLLFGFLLFGFSLLTWRGFFYFCNAFFFLFVSLTLAILISNLVQKKEAVSGIVNVIALGSAFLCGAFVPVEWLPSSVLKIAHVLPTYWYIQGNEFLKTAEKLQISELGPLAQNMFFLVLFGIGFFGLNLLLLRMKQKRNG